MLGRPNLRDEADNHLIDDMTTVMLAEFDAETRFRLRASQGAGRDVEGLALLDKALHMAK